MDDSADQSFSDIASYLSSLNTNASTTNQQLGSLIQAILSVFPIAGMGTFTLGAAVATTVSATSVKSNSVIIPFPTNAAAGTLQGSAKSLYVSGRSVGVSFTVSTASGVAAAGGETFAYLIANPTT